MGVPLHPPGQRGTSQHVWPTPTYKETTISLQNYVRELVFMSLQFIIGPAGSGKTRHIVRSIVDSLINDGEVLSGAMPHPAPNILLLVPDQATFQMEKRVLEESCLEGFMRLQVFSFRRLAWKVLEETGGVTLPFMTAVGRMAIQSIPGKTARIHRVCPIGELS